MKDHIEKIKDELVNCVKVLFTLRSAWIYLPVILAFAGSHMIFFPELDWILDKGLQEKLALILVGAVALVLLISCILSGNFISIYLFILAVNFLIRELDDSVLNIPYYGAIEVHSKKYIYMALAVIALWGFFKAKNIISFFKEHVLVRTMMVGTVFSYVLSQVVARRALRHILPYEKQIHIQMEELTENFAHLFFLAVAIAILCYSFKRKDQEKDQSCNSSV